MNHRIVSAVAALTVTVFVPTLNAATVFNNFGPGDQFSDSGLLLQGESVGTIGDVDQAAAFTVGANAYFLTGISLGLFVDTPPNSGTGPISIELAADSGGLPGAILRTFPTVANSTGKQVLSVSDNGSFLLNPNTTYWVIADGTGTFDGSWNDNTIGDVGPSAGRSNNGAWSLDSPPNPDHFAFSVEGRLGRSVPEGGSVSLLGACVMGLMAWVRCRWDPKA